MQPGRKVRVLGLGPYFERGCTTREGQTFLTENLRLTPFMRLVITTVQPEGASLINNASSPEFMSDGGNVVDGRGRTPLMLAENAARARALLPISNINAQCARGGTALMYAIKRRDLETAQMLLECDQKIQNNLGETALMIAVNVLPEIVVDLIHNHNLVDKKGRTALMYRSRVADKPLDILSQSDVNKRDRTGFNALFHAKNAAHVAWLLERKADPHATSLQKTTVLMEAASRGRLDVVRFLVKSFPSLVNQRDKEGSTALFHAVQQTRVLEYLVQAKADTGIQDEQGSTVLAFASREPTDPEAVQLLMRYGAPGSPRLYRDPFYKSLFEHFQSNSLKLPQREDDTCCICTSDIVDWRRVTLVCGHSFHTSCFNSWRKNCPTCRGANIFAH